MINGTIKKGNKSEKVMSYGIGNKLYKALMIVKKTENEYQSKLRKLKRR